MEIFNYLGSITLVLVLLGLFAVALRYIAHGGRFVPKFLAMNTRFESIPIRIAAIKVLDARRKIVLVDCANTRYVLLLSQNHDKLLDKLPLPAVSEQPASPPPPPAGKQRRKKETADA